VCESDTALIVKIDEGRMIQVLSNLLSNAIKFSPPNSAVEVVVKQNGTHASVYVTDHGAGIADEFKPRIFEKFSQADGSVTKKYSGTGLGLSIAKMMVEKMGGEIGFSSELGVGASFFVHFPLQIKP
jgi:signal transduction histidine kinase